MAEEHVFSVTMRQAAPADAPAIADLSTRVFGRPDEARIIEQLERDGDVWLSAVACFEEQVVGHILFYQLRVRGRLGALGLGPMCVDPWVQRQRIGMSLIRYGLDAAQAAGAPIVFVLGHADYYPRMGFSTAAAKDFVSPWSGRPEFMALRLKFGPPMSGELIFPNAFGVTPTAPVARPVGTTGTA